MPGCAPGLPHAPGSPGTGLVLAYAWLGAHLSWPSVLRRRATVGSRAVRATGTSCFATLDMVFGLVRRRQELESVGEGWLELVVIGSGPISG